MRTGLPPDPDTQTGRIFIPGIPLLPAPSPDLKLEHKFKNNDFRGFIDVFAPGANPPLVIDHKTTKNFRWALTPENIHEDFQAIIYANQAMRETGADTVALRWVYYKTTGVPEAMKVEGTFYKTKLDKAH